MNDTLVYTICDMNYIHFIPLFILSHIINDKCDVEVGIITNHSVEWLDKVAEELQNMHPANIIKIRYLTPELVKRYRKTDRLFINSLRFLIEPTIKREYVYITDIDIINCTPHFISYLKKDMEDNHRPYSNIVRDKCATKKKMSGLHFTKWNSYYPVNINKVKYSNDGDECLLYNIVAPKVKIDLQTTYRPVFGPHCSPNRKPTACNGIPGWNFEPYNDEFIKIVTSDSYYKLLDIIPWDTIDLVNTLLNLYNHQSILPKCAVITYIFGINNEILREPEYVDPNVEYICVTDNPDLTSKTWRIIYDVIPQAKTTRDKMVYVKYNPFKYTSARVLITVDGTIKITNSIQLLIDKFKKADMLIKRHPERNNLQDELMTWNKTRGLPLQVIEQFKIMAEIDKVNLSNDFLIESCVLGFRRNSKVQNLCAKVIAYMQFLGTSLGLCKTNQCVLTYLLQLQKNIRYEWIVQQQFFKRYNHNSNVLHDR